DALVTAVARAAVAGVDLDWNAFYGPAAEHVDLPTYAFQRESYWLRDSGGGADLTGAGLTAADHPLLGAVVVLPDDSGVVCTGRLSTAASPWLSDHVVLGQTIVPGTALVELAITAGDHVGCSTLRELTIEAPLVLPETAAVQIRVIVGADDGSGDRPVAVYSGDDTGWPRHASGRVSSGSPVRSDAEMAVWPPARAEPVDVDDAYAALAAHGYAYGPAFQGVRRVWRRGEEVFAEVVLPEGGAERFALHPALFDACLHPLLMTGGSGATILPFAWQDVAVQAVGATSVRVRLTRPTPASLSLQLADAAGNPVATVASLAGRPVTAQQLGDSSRSMYALDWLAAPVATAPSAASPQVLRVTEPADGPLSLLAEVLGEVQWWVADDIDPARQLLVVTSGAVAAIPGEPVRPAMAAVWGLVRSAQAEHPGRLVLVDVPDGAPVDLAAAVGPEPQLAWRDGGWLMPRVVRSAPAEAEPVSAPDLTDGTVLVTGGTSGLGALAARHLVARHGVRNLLLVSRRGGAAPGVPELLAELREAGAATVKVLAADVADPAELAGVLATVDPRHRLIGVVHAAGVLDDGMVTALTPQRLAGVWGPKAGAAGTLHELTAGLDLRMFVLFSSAAGVLGNPGQASYAAANAYLDGLALLRGSLGLPALSLAWGLWDQSGGITEGLSVADRSRLARSGVRPLSAAEGLALLDAALAGDARLLIPMGLQPQQLAAERTPPILHGLVPARRRMGTATALASDDSLRQRLAGLPADAWHAAVLDRVRAEAALVLALPSAHGVPADREFQELGFDSLTAVELRSRMKAATGLDLPPTMVFAFPTAAALASEITARLQAAPLTGPSAAPAALAAPGSITALFKDACLAGRIQDGAQLLMVASMLRKAFTEPVRLDRRPAPVRLARGPATPTLICFPAFSAVSGAHEYARFAATLLDVRGVTALPQPGFDDGELLPASLVALAQVQADAVLAVADGQEFALLGRSAGGWVANIVARELESRGVRPAAVVLLDTYPCGGAGPALTAMTRGMLERDGAYTVVDDYRLTAMGGYTRIFREWKPEHTAAPTLFVRARDPYAIEESDGTSLLLEGSWELEHALIDVPGNHFSMLEDHSDTTALAVHEWLLAQG
ncbi:type I polyketide synthase, partial [Micromonospora sp. NPDC049044]|uniref:type I polyketide synthase n=1 Tax=Micromonospora sp. NPDC049044 TaxID=3154827 RepID=UPI0033DEB460